MKHSKDYYIKQHCFLFLYLLMRVVVCYSKGSFIESSLAASRLKLNNLSWNILPFCTVTLVERFFWHLKKN